MIHKAASPTGAASVDAPQEARLPVAMYHPDPDINAEVIMAALDAERADLAAGYAPRAWTCPCGATHSRGHFGTIGQHRCLSCGYVGTGGIMRTLGAADRPVRHG